MPPCRCGWWGSSFYGGGGRGCLGPWPGWTCPGPRLPERVQAGELEGERPEGGRGMNETLWGRLFRGARRLRQLPLWTQFAGPDWAEHIMEVPVRDRFHAKQGRTIARW